KNENENKNANESKNENSNENSNENKLENSVDNKLDNKVDNSIENSVENKVENEVNVDVKVDLDLSGLDIQPAIEVGHLDGILFQMPDTVDQNICGDGTNTNFNLDQVNNLVDNDTLYNPEVSFTSYGTGGLAVGALGGDAEASGGFSMSASAEGGYAK